MANYEKFTEQEIPFGILERFGLTQEMVEETKFSFKTVLGLTIVFVWSFISLSNVSTFIYFQY